MFGRKVESISNFYNYNLSVFTSVLSLNTSYRHLPIFYVYKYISGDSYNSSKKFKAYIIKAIFAVVSLIISKHEFWPI